MHTSKLLFILVFVPIVAIAEESILDRANNVITKLEVINNVGRGCDYQLSVKGMEGANSESCQKYMTNIQGPYFDEIGKECVALSNWYEEKRKFVSTNKNYVDKNPTEAKRLVRDMKAVNKACHPDSLESYEFLKKPAQKMKALGALK